eukprot:3934564-Rhodomonas_salina.2
MTSRRAAKTGCMSMRHPAGVLRLCLLCLLRADVRFLPSPSVAYTILFPNMCTYRMNFTSDSPISCKCGMSTGHSYGDLYSFGGPLKSTIRTRSCAGHVGRRSVSALPAGSEHQLTADIVRRGGLRVCSHGCTRA